MIWQGWRKSGTSFLSRKPTTSHVLKGGEITMGELEYQFKRALGGQDMQGQGMRGGNFSTVPYILPVQPDFNRPARAKLLGSEHKATIRRGKVKLLDDKPAASKPNKKGKAQKGKALFFDGIPISQQDGSALFFDGVPISKQDGSKYKKLNLSSQEALMYGKRQYGKGLHQY